MGMQIIKQPDGRFALWSSVADGIAMYDASAQDIEDFFAEEAEKDTRRRVREKIAHVEAGHPEQVYFQFAMTWDEALREHTERHGPLMRVLPT